MFVAVMAAFSNSFIPLEVRSGVHTDSQDFSNGHSAFDLLAIFLSQILCGGLREAVT